MADKKISIFTPATSVGGTDKVPILQSGQNKIADADLLHYQSISFTASIPFNKLTTRIAPVVVSGALTFSKNTTGAVPGYTSILRVTADGSNVPDLSAFKKIGSGSYVNTNGTVNQLIFFYDGNDYCVVINQPTAISSGGGGGPTQLATPTLTAACYQRSTEIDLSWTNVANESSYKLEWSPNGTSGWAQIGGTIAANTTSYNHTGLTASTHYYYRITAVGDGTTYSDSNFGTDDDTTSAPGAVQLNTPGSFALNVISSTEIDLTWTDTNTSPNETQP
jgi:hypothetical protein